MEHLLRIEDQGVEVQALENMPQLPDDLQKHWSAFCELDSGRQWGYGAPQPLAIADVVLVCEVYSLTGDDFYDFVYFARELDRLYLKRQADKRNA